MAGVEAADASGEIEIAIAVHVFEDRAFSARRENGRSVGRAARDGGFAADHEGARLGAGNFGADLNRFHGSVLRLVSSGPPQTADHTKAMPRLWGGSFARRRKAWARRSSLCRIVSGGRRRWRLWLLSCRLQGKS